MLALYNVKDFYWLWYSCTFLWDTYSVPISGSRFVNYEPFLRFHEPLFEEFQKNCESKERHFLTFVARFLMPL